MKSTSASRRCFSTDTQRTRTSVTAARMRGWGRGRDGEGGGKGRTGDYYELFASDFVKTITDLFKNALILHDLKICYGKKKKAKTKKR